MFKSCIARNIKHRIQLLINPKQSIVIHRQYSTEGSTTEESNATSANSTTSPLDYDVKAERKQTKKDMRGLSDKFRVPPQIGVDDEMYIKAMEEHLAQSHQQEGESPDQQQSVVFSSSLEIQQDVTPFTLDAKAGEHTEEHPKHSHHRGRPPHVPKGSLSKDAPQEPSKDTTIAEE
uniref:Predicted protein n=1 Tax=Hordeum vulgare subsp. vulgare TaxID=112509 RepID=F2DGC1_HORVV|nr:predicted protein [Hordeum vulgare subsp. vulgare]